MISIINKSNHHFSSNIFVCIILSFSPSACSKQKDYSGHSKSINLKNIFYLCLKGDRNYFISQDFMSRKSESTRRERGHGTDTETPNTRVPSWQRDRIYL